MRIHSTIAAITVAAACAVGLPASQAASLDAGKASYNGNCASCHGPLIAPYSAAQIRDAIRRNKGGMIILSSLSDAELQNIAAYLATPNGNDSDRLFNWAEAAAPSLLSPRATSQNVSGYYLRHYSNTNVYLATQNGRVYYYDASKPVGNSNPADLGTITDWLAQAGL